MKNWKKILLLLLAVMLAFGIFGCKRSGKTDTNDGPGTNSDNSQTSEKENLIYNSDTKISLIIGDHSLSDVAVSDIYNYLFRNVYTNVKIYIDEIPEKADHEIILGRTDRDISKRAYTLLEREELSAFGEAGYLIYSDGSSIAIAHSESLNYEYLGDVVLKFLDSYFTEEVVAPKGVIKKEVVNILDTIKEDDKARQEAQWANLEKKAGAEVVAAMKRLYSLYTPNVVSWLANLYEPRVCVCTTVDENGNKVCQHPTDEFGEPLCYYGGFYYSNSGRNTVGYAPDIESTNQALSFIESSGMLQALGGRYASNLPTWMKNEIIGFVKGLQDPDGYFYHPQWSRELHHQNPERMGRDLSWATSMLKNFGVNPYYTTPGGGMIGEGKPSQSQLTSKLSLSSVNSVSQVIPTAGLNAHLATPETFKAYLDSLNIKTASYSAGSTVGAQTTTIKELDRKLAGVTSGAGFDYRNRGVYSKILFDWLDENQNPANGLWDMESDYQACDGLFKIVNIYNDYGLPMKYPLEAALATIDAISSDEQVYTVCNMYNAWANIGLIKNNLRNNSSDKAAAKELIATINAAIIEVAPEALRITAEKTANFAIPDGSFSYLIGKTSETSTGMPTAVVNSYEGDINATLICIGGLIGHINNAIDAPKVYTHGLADWYNFVNIIENNNPSIKDDTLAGNKFDFEKDNIDENPANVKISVSSDGYITVKDDPTGASNKVLNIHHPYAPGNGDSAQIKNGFYSLGRNCSIFESDFYVASAETDNTYVAQFTLGGAYYFTLRIANDKVGIWEDTSTELVYTKARHLADVDLDKWFNVRIEYYYGDHDSVRIKFYVNGNLVAISANYGDPSGNNIKNESGKPKKGFEYLLVYPLSYVNLDLYMDNVLLTSENVKYVSGSDLKGLVVNADITGGDKITYDFEDNTLPEEFEVLSGGSNMTVSDGALNLAKDSQTSKITIPVNLREALFNSYAFGFDIDFSDAADGEVLNFALTEPYHFEGKTVDITKISVNCITEDGQKYLVVVAKNGATTFTSSKIAVDDDATSLDFIYYTKQKQTLIYKNGEFIGLTDFVIPSNPHQYELGYITLTYKGNITGTLDNFYVESRKGDFAEDTTPDVDRFVSSFDDGIKGVSTNGALMNGALYLADGKFVSIPVNNRVDTVFSYEFGFDIDLSKTQSSKYTRVSLLDENGKNIFALDMSYNGEILYLYEVSEHGRYPIAVAEIQTTPALSLKLNYYPADGIVSLMANGSYVLATGIFCTDELSAASSAKILTYDATVDNIYFDGLIFTYTYPVISGVNKDNLDEVITFEHSSLGLLPGSVTTTLSTTKASYGIDLMMKNGQLTKVYKMTSASGGNDYTDFVYGGEATGKLVYETDLYLNTQGYFEIHVLRGSSSDASSMAYRAILWTSGTNLKMYDTSSNSNHTPGPEKVIGKIGQWMKFKIEIDLGDGTPGTTKINTYVDGNLVYESQNFFGSYKSDIPTVTSLNRVRFYTWSGGTGDFIFDNSSLKAGECLHAKLTEGEILTTPGCTTEGEKELICSNPDCDYKTTEKIPETGHDMGEWIPDETDPTVEISSCKNCDHSESRVVEIPEEPDPDEPGGGDDTEGGDFIDGGGWTPTGKN